MAAHMQKALKISGIKINKSRRFGGEYASLRTSLVNFVSSSSDSAGSSNAKSPETEIAHQESPNPTIVLDTIANLRNTRQEPRNARNLPNLIKPAFQDEQSNQSFATLFRDSNFAHLGNSRGKVVVGTIFRVVGDDLYVDFDWKFPCVVKKPSQDAHLYVTNAVVRLRIIDLEMSTIFLGATRETSLNEANCALLGLINSPLGVPQSQEVGN